MTSISFSALPLSHTHACGGNQRGPSDGQDRAWNKSVWRAGSVERITNRRLTHQERISRTAPRGLKIKYVFLRAVVTTGNLAQLL